MEVFVERDNDAIEKICSKVQKARIFLKELENEIHPLKQTNELQIFSLA